MGPLYVTYENHLCLRGGSLVGTIRYISLSCNGIWEMQMT